MSLKGFHILFIVLAILCMTGFAAWTFLADGNGALLRAAGVASGALGVALTFYGYWFVTKKSKRLII